MPDSTGSEEVRRAIARGDYLIAYDLACDALRALPGDVTLRYLAALALARTGATEQAEAEIARLRVDRAALADEPVEVAEDVDALHARLAKDRALSATGEQRRQGAARAAALYEAIATRLGRPYSCINAATLWLVAGDHARAQVLAERALAQIDSAPDDTYWTAATRAEAALLLGRTEAAAAALEAAATLSIDDPGARATTRRQLRLVCDLTGLDRAILSPLAAPLVVHYTGHRELAGSSEHRVAAEVSRFFDDQRVGIVYGSLASGSDIIAAEAAIERGLELHVVLPFGVDEFEAVSVRPAGAEWCARFHRCLAAADAVRFATNGAWLGDATLFAYAARIAMGHALQRAAFLDAPVEQLAIWDGLPSEEEGGTAHDVGAWRAAGHPTHVVRATNGAANGSATAPSGPRRQVRAVLFSDLKGFSRLGDDQMGAFLDVVMRPLATALDAFDRNILRRNSWGDGLHLVLRDVVSAAECALALQEALDHVDLQAAGLPVDLGMRIGVHAGPVFEVDDPVRHEPSYYGREITRTARIEPRTPEGHVYASDSFAALLALEPDSHVTCEYVGPIPTAKDFETLPMYLLRRASVTQTPSGSKPRPRP